MSDRESTVALRSGDAAVSAAAQRVFERPFVVEAGAGTGKTTLLVARCLAWMLGPGWKLAEQRLASGDVDQIAAEVLSRVAAITFTEAAAAEMANRLGEVLAEIAVGTLRQGIDAGALSGPEPMRRERARALLGALDRWVVRTIHAFCRRLLAQHSIAAGLHPEFQVDADDRVTLAVAREVVEGAVREGYGDPGDPDLIELGADGFGPAEIEDALLVLLREAVEPRALSETFFTPEVIARLLEELRNALSNFENADGGRLAAVGKRSRKTVDVLDAIAASTTALARCGGDVSAFDVYADALREHWPKDLRKRLGGWSTEAGFNATEAKILGDAALPVSAAAAPLLRAIEHTVELRPLRFERGRRALCPLVARAREKLRERGAIGYTSLLREARDLLRDQPSLRAHLRSGYDQLLVDEFQDTDPVQCDIVRLLALDGAADARPGLFLVGDPKQSIYGWRAADLRAYTSLVGEALGQGRAPALLCVNRRSVPAILEEVERALEPAMRKSGPDQSAFQRLVASEQREREALAPASPRAFVEHWVTWSWDEEAGKPLFPSAGEAAKLEAEALARDLALLKQTDGFEWRHAGVLMRTWSDLEVYLHALREAGIPYRVEGGRSYYQRREVIDASALVRCVLDPNDHMALLTWLRSPSVGVPDAALIPLWTRDFPALVSALASPGIDSLAALDRVIEAALADLPGEIPGLERVDGWDRNLSFAVAGIAHLRASFERDATDVFVEKLRTLSLLEVTEAARFPGAFRLANLDRFFRELCLELGAEDADAQALLRRLRSDIDSERAIPDARPEHAGEDAVQILTIHGAKGLEFRHCYVVQLHKGAGGRRRARGKPVAKEVEGRWEISVFGAPSPEFAAVEEQAERVAAAERARSLYVAMTRARDRLVLLGSWPISGRGRQGAKGDALIDLLGTRRDNPTALEDAMVRAHADGRDGEIDGNGVRWSFPALWPAQSLPTPEDSIAGEREDLAATLSDMRSLVASREVARRRMARLFRAPASGDSHSEAREEEAARRMGASDLWRSAPPRDREAEIAKAAGTAVHRVLEELRLDAPLRAELERQRARLPGMLDRLAGEEERSAVLARARALLGRLAEPCFAIRLAAIRDGVIARELSVLLPAEPQGDGPVGFVTGAIDLLYRDPVTSELVIADYKTDHVAGADALAERSRHYAAQAAHYRRAVQEALALERAPRFELWFLQAGAIVSVG